MIRRRAVLDTVNPPGQARYLRDVIMRIQDEDRIKAESADTVVIDRALFASILDMADRFASERSHIKLYDRQVERARQVLDK